MVLTPVGTGCSLLLHFPLLPLLAHLRRARFFTDPLARLLIHDPQERGLRFPLREGFDIEILSAVLQ